MQQFLSLCFKVLPIVSTIAYVTRALFIAAGN